MNKLFRKNAIGRVLIGAAVAGALTFGVAGPANAATGYAIGGKTPTLSTTTATSKTYASAPVIIHAPSMASSEGCPDSDDLEDGIEVTMIHPDGTQYNCNTGDYVIN